MVDMGFTDLGESRVQELTRRAAAIERIVHGESSENLAAPSHERDEEDVIRVPIDEFLGRLVDKPEAVVEDTAFAGHIDEPGLQAEGVGNLGPIGQGAIQVVPGEWAHPVGSGRCIIHRDRHVAVSIALPNSLTSTRKHSKSSNTHVQ